MGRKVAVIMMGIVGVLASLVCPALAKAVVVAHKAVPVDSVSAADLRDIALGNKKQWKNGDLITFVTLSSGPVHEEFLKIYAAKSPVQFSSYWKRELFSGKGKPPRHFESEAALVRFVAETAGALGYVADGTDTGAVKVLSVGQ
jgi:hypothetical protein